MDFDLSKENIQPLRGGRNVSQLGVALQAQMDTDSQRELLAQKAEFERLIRTYTGDDPLENWYNFISWVEQSYPKQGHEGNLVSLLEHCLKLFENDVRYKEDRRLCKLFIKYIDQQQNPLELYHMMYAQGICRSCADMYKAWAYYFEAAGDFRKAHKVFECGKRELAQPYEELLNAHENLVVAAGQHIIYGPNYQDLSEKREALTSLATYKPGHVGSIRKASMRNDETIAGVAITSRPNASIPIYEDRGGEDRTDDIGPISIISAAKRQEVPKENTLKPGPWMTIPVKKKSVNQNLAPSFTVHEDSGDFSGRSKPRVAMTLENYSNWIVSLTIPEPVDEKKIPMYPKEKVYSEISTEYSLEELRAMRWTKERKICPTTVKNRSVSATLENTITLIDHLDSKNSSSEQNNVHLLPNNIFSTCDAKQINRDANDSQLSTKNISNRQSVQFQSPHSSSQTVMPELNFDLWNSFSDETRNTSLNMVSSKPAGSKFSIYEQSNLAFQDNIEPKGSAMKTPFNDLNAEELAETGSRGGMDIAAAAPVDGAKRLPLYEDDSSLPKKLEGSIFEDSSCNTQMFGFNLNVMQVSTPQNKPGHATKGDKDAVKITAKQLFTESIKPDDKVLSTILEETKSYRQSSSGSSSNGTTKSFFLGSNTKQQNMATISEEHNSYLAQNLMVNAALRSSLGDLMDFDHHSSTLTTLSKTPTINSNEVQRSSEPTKVTPLDFVPSDPFKQTLIDNLLERVRFPGPHTHGFFYVNTLPKLAVRKESVYIGLDKYVIEKQLGKGTYGTVFRGVEVTTGNTVAVKIQKPANKWEFYICRELQARLAHHHLRERFMDVKIGYFSEQASVLISEFMPCGSLLDVANTIKQKSGRPMKESLCIHFCLEMLKIVQAMHEVKIIHADIKPDNFLVQLFPNDSVGLQLIDFGCSIDMSLFPSGASFFRKVTTENFICCEMLDNRPWNYHTDLFCIAATAHVLLFEKYIHLQKRGDHWSISNRLPRYARVDLWNEFFSTLLNQQDGPTDSLLLQSMLEDSLNHKFDDYHNELRYLINILKNR